VDAFFAIFYAVYFNFFLTASKDPNALHFAFENDADVVTSSSVMQLLVDVHPYSLHNSASRRDIPVLIKDFECGFANF
jgi:hypothetical protein